MLETALDHHRFGRQYGADMERRSRGRAAAARRPHLARLRRGGHPGQRSHHHRFERQHRKGVGRQNRHRAALAKGTLASVTAVPSLRTGPESSPRVGGDQRHRRGCGTPAPARERLQLKGHTGRVKAVAVTPDGARIVTGSQRQHRAGMGRRHRRGAASAQGPACGAKRRGHARRDPHHHRLGRQHRAGMGRRQRNRTASAQGPYGARSRASPLTPDGTRIVTGSLDGTARVWDIGTGDEMLRLNAGPRLRRRRGGHTGRRPHRHRFVRRYSPGVGRPHRRRTAPAQGHTRAVRSMAVTPDGTRILTGSDDDTLRGYGTPVTGARTVADKPSDARS